MTKTKTDDPNDALGGARLIDLFFSDPFPLEAAAQLGSTALGSDLSALVTDSIIGIFDSHHFKIKTGMGGVRLWYCLNEDEGSKLPKFFLALEQIEEFNKFNPEETTKPSDSLFIVPEVSGYHGGGTDKDHVMAFIRDTVVSTGPENNRTIEQSQVIRYASNFRRLMTEVFRDTGFLFCQYTVAFFEENTSYSDFMKENHFKVKYIIGLSKHTSHFPNFLRPILIGVNTMGRTVITPTAGSEHPFLQKSIPPPPPELKKP